ncbi:MAG: hypothetical protein ACOCWY_00075 [Thermodesulfobacteriota bacterium]
MNRFVCLMLCAFLLLPAGCATISPDRIDRLPEFDKVYYVVFEDEPKLDTEDIYLKGMKIGNIISQKEGPDDLHVMKISIQAKYEELMMDNVAFLVSDGRLEYETVADEGDPLDEGAKLLGFHGRTGLYWFKTKSTVKSASKAAMEKAEELYYKTVK